MKKWLSLLLAMALLVTASFALAEEGQNKFYSSTLEFGADPHTAAEKYISDWAMAGYTLTAQPALETKALSDGTEYVVQTFVTSEGDAAQMTGKLFYVNGILVAGVEDMTLPEGFDPAGLSAQVESFLGGPKPFSIGTIGPMAEMIGEPAHLDAVQDSWQYQKEIIPSGTDQAVTVNAYVAIAVVDGHGYMAEWFSRDTQGTHSAELHAMNGFDELTPEQKTSVGMYAEFLEVKKKEQLQQYIDFLRNKKQ